VAARLAAIAGAILSGLVLAQAPRAALAQVNIDQGKSPAQIFANDCASCHKAPRGLGAGKNSASLTGFLREHYTASREQAASLAAYVLGAGGGPAAAATTGPKPAAAAATAAGTPAGAKVEPPSRAARPSAKPEEATPATAKLQEPKSEEEPAIVPGRREPTNAARGHRKEPESSQPTPEPAAVIAEPAQPPAEGSAPTGEAAPVPRDDIPD
jgi:hypothetical protein